MSNKRSISVFGLGKLGLTLASSLSANGHQVIGVDIDSSRVAAINNGSIQTNEPGVMERLKKGRKLLSATTVPETAVHSTDLSIIIVPTPSNTIGGFSLHYVMEAIEMIGRSIRTKKEKHFVSVMSTVFPGSSDTWIIPQLETTSERRLGEGLGYCYSPFFVALGEIVKGIESPEYVLIGETTQESGDCCVSAFDVVSPKTPIIRMCPLEAEITKLASNAHDTMRVSFANQLMAVCIEMGARVDLITEALSHRIGSRFLKGGGSFGGPCWPRDNKAFSLMLKSVGLTEKIPVSIDEFNQEHSKYLFRKIFEHASNGTKIGIMGLSYKTGTDFTEQAWSLNLIQWLLEERYQVIGWDPLAKPRIKGMHLASNGNQCLQEADLTVIAQPLIEVKSLDWRLAKTKKIIDCWRFLSPVEIESIGTYVPLGQGVDSCYHPPRLYVN
jgi:UDPglucose 6-dehydrogenase